MFFCHLRALESSQTRPEANLDAQREAKEAKRKPKASKRRPKKDKRHQEKAKERQQMAKEGVRARLLPGWFLAGRWRVLALTAFWRDLAGSWEAFPKLTKSKQRAKKAKSGMLWILNTPSGGGGLYVPLADAADTKNTEEVF